MSTLHRAQLLLESVQHEALAKVADLEGRSISDLVREILREHLAERDQRSQILSGLQAVERLSEIRGALREEHVEYGGDPVAEVRAEWEEGVERVWRGEE